IREMALPIIERRADEMWSALRADSKTSAERDAARADPTLDWRLATRDGRFAMFLDCGAIATLVAHDPAAFLDGKVFTTGWAGWGDAEARDRQGFPTIRPPATQRRVPPPPGRQQPPGRALCPTSVA